MGCDAPEHLGDTWVLDIQRVKFLVIYFHYRSERKNLGSLKSSNIYCTINCEISWNILADQNFIRNNLRHVKDLRLFCSYKEKESIKAMSKDVSIWLYFGWLWVVVNGGGFFSCLWEIIDTFWQLMVDGWWWNFWLMVGGGVFPCVVVDGGGWWWVKAKFSQNKPLFGLNYL